MMPAVNAVARRSYELLSATLQQLALVDELARRIGLPFHRNTHAISLALTVEGNRIISRARKVSRPCGETFVTSITRHNSLYFEVRFRSPRDASAIAASSRWKRESSVSSG